jgi:hypothetical protein
MPEQDDLEEYLGELEVEIAAERRDLQAAREARPGQT